MGSQPLGVFYVKIFTVPTRGLKSTTHNRWFHHHLRMSESHKTMSDLLLPTYDDNQVITFLHHHQLILPNPMDPFKLIFLHGATKLNLLLVCVFWTSSTKIARVKMVKLDAFYNKNHIWDTRRFRVPVLGGGESRGGVFVESKSDKMGVTMYSNVSLMIEKITKTK